MYGKINKINQLPYHIFFNNTFEEEKNYSYKRKVTLEMFESNPNYWINSNIKIIIKQNINSPVCKLFARVILYNRFF